MPLIHVVAVILVIAVLLGLINWVAKKFPSFFYPLAIQILNAVVIVVLVLWILALFLPIGSISKLRVGP